MRHGLSALVSWVLHLGKDSNASSCLRIWWCPPDWKLYSSILKVYDCVPRILKYRNESSICTTNPIYHGAASNGRDSAGVHTTNIVSSSAKSHLGPPQWSIRPQSIPLQVSYRSFTFSMLFYLKVHDGNIFSCLYRSLYLIGKHLDFRKYQPPLLKKTWY